MGEHLTADGEFQSDKYKDWCPPGFVPLKLSDKMAQPLLWQYAETRRGVDQEFADDLQQALRLQGYDRPESCWLCGRQDGPFVEIVTQRETPNGPKCKAKNVKVHNGCYMDVET